ncbi:MAG: neutral/alkaline non-lysosomal ceramidase N-terminal domain-containing protein [Chloroflexota bacterium]
MKTLAAGAAFVDISPQNPQFLYGYPHVERYSTGIHDPLLSSALYLSDGQTEILFVANDIIYIGQDTAQRVRQRIEAASGVPAAHIMLTASHTHSGPKTVELLSNEHDPVIPPVDPAYLQWFEEGIFRAAVAARQSACPARLGLAVADGSGIGTNRRDPVNGPIDPQTPVLMVQTAGGERNIACMLVYSMHPTALHEDSTLVSADFPGMARQFLQQTVLGQGCPVLHHTGPAGNQSLRYVTRENTFAEAKRLGRMLAQAVQKVMPQITYTSQVSLSAAQGFVELPRREFPSMEEAQTQLERAEARLAQLRREGAARQEIRSAEVNWFGAEETLTLTRAACQGRLETVYRSCLPAEVQVFQVGPWAFVSWPGEIFVEHALAVKARRPNTFVISLANGELQGYIVTEKAARQGGYEVSNALFGPASGQMLVDTALRLFR